MVRGWSKHLKRYLMTELCTTEPSTVFFFGYVRLFWCLPTSSETLRSVRLSIWKRSHCHCYVNITYSPLDFCVLPFAWQPPPPDTTLYCSACYCSPAPFTHESYLKLCIRAPVVKSCQNNYRVLLIESLHVQHPAQQWMCEREHVGAIISSLNWKSGNS